MASAIATGLLVGHAPRPAQWVFGAYVSVGLLYGLPIMPLRIRGRWSWFRLKDIPGFKSWLVGGAVTVAVVGLPAAWNGLSLDRSMWFIGVFVFVFTATNAHMFDVRDVEKDRETRVATLPVAISVRGTKMALIALNLVLIVLILYGWTTVDAGSIAAGGIVQPGEVPHPEVLACGAVTVAYVLMMSPTTPRERYAIIVDGCLFIPLLFASIHTWVS